MSSSASTWSPERAGAGRGPASLLFVASLLFLGRCAWPTDTTYLGGDPAPRLSVLDATPIQGAEGVPRDVTIVVSLDDRVDPASLEGVRLFAGPVEAQVARRVDHLDCTLLVKAHEPLTPLLRYQLAVTELAGLSGGQLESLQLGFQTGEHLGMPPEPEAPSLQRVTNQTFLPRCASCHSTFRPPAGLDLSSASAAAVALGGRDSLYRPGWPLVVEGSHAQSYLMAKLLDLPGIFGDPMPPGNAWPPRGCGEADEELRQVADWIDGLQP